jgi:hypothetical protein
MPKKVQLKLLSTSGELLNVVTCHSGQVTVFRAHSAPDLRPYQRALAGTPGKERITVSVDGEEYDPERHNLIGVGETFPHVGMSLEEYFNHNQVSSDNAAALLQSFGFSRPLTTPCAQLSPDEERRLRLLVATCRPDKVLVMNEPFEHISSQWKEQFAQLLTSFARQRGGIAIVTSLSFRPECWIDNDSVARVQVGETIQRTIGFGAAGSKGNDLINQLRDAVRSEATPSRQDSTSASPALGAAMGVSGVAASQLLSNSREVFQDVQDSPSQSSSVGKDVLASLVGSQSEKFGVLAANKVPLILAGVGITCALVSIGIFSSGDTQKDVALNTQVGTEEVLQNTQNPPAPIQDGGAKPALTHEGASQTSSTVVNSEPPQLREENILDGYPEVVRVSLIETARGNVVGAHDGNSQPSTSQTTNSQTPPSDSGNLFRLLESASSKSDERNQQFADQGNQEQPSSWQAPSNEMATEEVDPSEEQQRREAIRQKFLDAIRAAAEKRQASMDDTGT